jgi:hypothetical protein
VSKKWPKWLIPICVSNPSSVVPLGVFITPALLTRRWRGISFDLNWAAKLRTDWSEFRSKGMNSILISSSLLEGSSFVSSDLIEETAAFPRSWLRHAKMRFQINLRYQE